MEILVPIVGFIVFYYIVSVISDNKLRRLIIQKGEVDENVKYLFRTCRPCTPQASLKWGMVLVAVGLGLLAGRLLDNLGLGSDETTFALMLVLGGIALIAFYFMANKLAKKEDQQ